MFMTYLHEKFRIHNSNGSSVITLKQEPKKIHSAHVVLNSTKDGLNTSCIFSIFYYET